MATGAASASPDPTKKPRKLDSLAIGAALASEDPIRKSRSLWTQQLQNPSFLSGP